MQHFQLFDAEGHRCVTVNLWAAARLICLCVSVFTTGRKRLRDLLRPPDRRPRGVQPGGDAAPVRAALLLLSSNACSCDCASPLTADERWRHFLILAACLVGVGGFVFVCLSPRDPLSLGVRRTVWWICGSGKPPQPHAVGGVRKWAEQWHAAVVYLLSECK